MSVSGKTRLCPKNTALYGFCKGYAAHKCTSQGARRVVAHHSIDKFTKIDLFRGKICPKVGQRFL